MRFYLKKDLLFLLLLPILALATRLSLLFASDFVIDSDEAIVGLMAKHILEGRDFPVFYYGQDYMGSLEAILTVPFFYFFSISNVYLKAVPLIFSVLHVYLVYELALRFTDRFGARVASTLCALAPSALILWSTKARGGFIELVALGTLALILSIDLLRAEKPNKKGFLALGAVLGLAWWTNNQIIFYIAAIFVVFFINFYRKLGFKKAFSFFSLTSLAFFVSSTPFWIYNLQRPFFRTFRFLLNSKSPSDSGFLDHFAGLFSKALPIIFGSRRFWSETDIISGFTPLLYLIYALCLGIFVFRGMRSKSRASFLLILLFVLLTLIIFSASGFGWLSLAPRYLLPLYSVIFVVLAVGISFLREKFRFPAYFLFLLLLSSNLLSNYYPSLLIPGEPFIYSGERVSHDHSELYFWLKKHNYRHINANYWLGYRAAFETKERVTFTRLGSPRSLRIEEYETRVYQKQNPEVYVSVPSEAELIARSFDAQGYKFRKSSASSYIIVDQIKPLYLSSELEELEISADQLSSSDRPDLLPMILDADLKTRWGSSRPQSPGMEVEVKFLEPVQLGAVYIEMGDFRHDGPRELVVEAQDEQGDWSILFDSYGTKMFYDAREGNYGALPETWKFFFKTSKLTTLRLKQKGKDPIFDWSIADLKIYRVKDK